MKRGLIIWIFAIIVLIGIFFFLFQAGEEIIISDDDSLWRNAEFIDIRTQEIFSVSDFSEPVLLESFAVWCPTCTRQQKETQKLHDELGNRIITISLDTDPNEEESRVKEHIESNGFTSYYAVSSSDTTQNLIDEFGIDIVNAPSVPMILVCDGKVKKLGRGVKKVGELKQEVEEFCGGF